MPAATGGSRGSASSALDRFLDEQIASGLYTAIAGWVGTPDGVLWRGAAGALRPDFRRSETSRPGGRRQGSVTAETFFDLASLTKLFTATLALRLDAAGLLPLTLEVGEIWPGRAHGRRLAGRTLEDLLRHRAGLRRWCPLYHHCSARHEVLTLLLGGSLLGERAGTYSDLGLILWGLAAEELLGTPLPKLLREQVMEPLGAVGPRLAPASGPAMSPPPSPATSLARVAACVADTGREIELAVELGQAPPPRLPPPAVGEPQDGNARFLQAGGFAFPSHAGLFGRLADLLPLASAWLRPGRLLSAQAVEHALTAPAGRAGGRRLLGWEARRTRFSAGPALSPFAFGHTGFTGGSLWLDPEGERVYVLLGHRTSPHSDLTSSRRRFHRLGAMVFG